MLRDLGQDEGRYRCHPVNYLCYCVMHGLVPACMLAIMQCTYGAKCIAIHDQFNTCTGLHMYIRIYMAFQLVSICV